MNWYSSIARGLLVALTVAVAGCGGGGFPSVDLQQPGPAAPAPAPVVANELVQRAVVAGQAVTIVVPANAPALAGATVDIPADAAKDDITVHIGFEDSAPGPFSAQAVANGVTPVSKTVVVKVANNGPATFNDVITVTIPYDVKAAGGLPPAILYWDEAAQVYQPVSVIAVDPVKGTVTFRTSHFSSFIAIILSKLSAAIPDVNTGFQLLTDSVLHQNFGSYQFGGHCAAFASLSSYYYGLKKPTRLYPFAQEGADEQPADDEVTRTALTLTYGLIARKWASVASSIVIPSSGFTGLLMIQSMLATGKPVHMVMHSNNATDGGHSVTVHAYDAATQSFKIYDSNFPKNETTMPWTLNGFGTYSRAASYPARMFDFIGFAADDTFGAPAQFQKIITDWESGKLRDFYANLQVTDENGTIRPLRIETPVTVKIPYQDNQTVPTKFNRPAGSTNPVFVHLFLDGVQASAAGFPLPASGEFVLNFPTKLENKVEVMMLVSEHRRDAFNGFSGFGKVTIQPEGKNFFVNFGFETGDLTAWAGATSLLPQGGGGAFTPTKLTVVPVGFDPIATDIPTAVFGTRAARVNDRDPNFHTTFLSQTATVPATGNPQLNFKWAAVLEDPQHAPNDQPFVEVSVRNVTKGIDLYRRRFFTNDPNFNGWKTYQSNGEWKAIDWQTVVLTGLSAHAGDQIELKIVGADCGLGGHGGYVYLDGEE